MEARRAGAGDPRHQRAQLAAAADGGAGTGGHELRTPLTAITGNLQLLLRQPAGDDEQRAACASTRQLGLQQARQLARLVDDLTDVVRLQEGRFRLESAPVELGPLLAELVEIAGLQADGQTIRYEAPGEPLVVEGDARRLQQVTLNLLTNAIKYAAGTEFIDVRLRRVNGHAELMVQDYGSGHPCRRSAACLLALLSGGRGDDAGARRAGSGTIHQPGHRGGAWWHRSTCGRARAMAPCSWCGCHCARRRRNLPTRRAARPPRPGTVTRTEDARVGRPALRPPSAIGARGAEPGDGLAADRLRRRHPRGEPGAGALLNARSPSCWASRSWCSSRPSTSLPYCAIWSRPAGWSISGRCASCRGVCPR